LELLPFVSVGLSAASAILVLLLFLRKPSATAEIVSETRASLTANQERLERVLVEAIRDGRRETAASASEQRQELAHAIRDGREVLTQQIEAIAQRCEHIRVASEERLEALRGTLREELTTVGSTLRDQQEKLRKESAVATQQIREEVERKLEGARQQSAADAAQARTALQVLVEANGKRSEELRATVEGKLTALQQDNATCLEKMRATVEEKLHGTLEKRLGESFKLVTERLEQVHQGLGEMQSLASGVGDLKKVMSNVRARGTWGEIQLGRLLEDMFTPDQYAKNVPTHPGRSERVEFALKLPGPDRCFERPVLLPIDAKFPREDYERILEASDRGDAAAIETATRALEGRVRDAAKDISTKYIAPPYTTDFGILFLPTEGLFAEVIRREGLADEIQRTHRIVIAGPTTLAALLNSLQMGFQTLAIQQRSSDAWEVLGAVKTEFRAFGAVMAKVHKKLQTASREVEQAQRRGRVMETCLRDVSALPGAHARQLLGLERDAAEESASVDSSEAETLGEELQ